MCASHAICNGFGSAGGGIDDADGMGGLGRIGGGMDGVMMVMIVLAQALVLFIWWRNGWIAMQKELVIWWNWWCRSYLWWYGWI